MFNRHPQATAGCLIVAHLARRHQRIDIDFNQAFVMPHRLKALHFNVVRFQSCSPGLARRRIVSLPAVIAPTRCLGKAVERTQRPRLLCGPAPGSHSCCGAVWPNPVFNRTPGGSPHLAFISFWAKRGLPQGAG